MMNESTKNGTILDDKCRKASSKRKPLPLPKKPIHQSAMQDVDSHNNNEKLTTVLQELSCLSHKSKEEFSKSTSKNSEISDSESTLHFSTPKQLLSTSENELPHVLSIKERMIPFEQPCIDKSKSLASTSNPSILSTKLDTGTDKRQILNIGNRPNTKYKRSPAPPILPKPVFPSPNRPTDSQIYESIKSPVYDTIENIKCIEIGNNYNYNDNPKNTGATQSLENEDIYDDVFYNDCRSLPPVIMPEKPQLLESKGTKKENLGSVIKNKERRHSSFCNDIKKSNSLDNKVGSDPKKSGILSAIVSAVKELGAVGTVGKERHSSSIFYSESDDKTTKCQFLRAKSHSLSKSCRLCSTNESKSKVNSVFYDRCDNVLEQNFSLVPHQSNISKDEKQKQGDNLQIRIPPELCNFDSPSPVIVQNKLKSVDSEKTVCVMNNSSAIDSNSDLNPKDLQTSEPIAFENKELWLNKNRCDSSNSDLKKEEERQRKVFKIAEEMMLSEQVFVDVLKLLNEDFRNEVEKANQECDQPIIPEATLNQILMYLPQLHTFNEQLLQDLTARISNWDQDPRIADIIMKKGPFLKLYTSYIKEFERMTSSLDDALKKYRLFAQVVKAFEMSPQCKMLALKHYMLKPIQRIPQYKLLLTDYLKHLPEDALDYKDTIAALKIVSEVANHINDSMKQGEALEKMVSIQNSLQGYEIIKPGRALLKEGSLLKLSRKGLQPRKFFLFNDCLLYATLSHDNFYRVNHELPLVGMKVNIPASEDFENEFSVISVKRSITVSLRTPEERDEWINALTLAIGKVTSRKSTFVKLHSADIENEHSDLLEKRKLGDHAPVWIPDARVTMCQICLSDFTLTFRRHHCRACGKVVCSECSQNRSLLQYINKGSARVCDECHQYLNSEGPENEILEDNDVNNSATKKLAISSNSYVRKNKRYVPKILKEVSANDEGAEMSGYLYKRKKSTWKKLWFVLKDKVLYTYKASQDCAALESIPLLGYAVLSEVSDGQYNIELTHPGQSPILFQAENEKIHQRWLKAMKEACIL